MTGLGAQQITALPVKKNTLTKTVSMVVVFKKHYI
jgi:hypothetical protein